MTGYDGAMSIDAPLALYESSVRPEWLDANDHMNVAYFVLAFDLASEQLYNLIGVDDDYIEGRRLTTFALEAHVTYRRELRGGDPIRATTQLLAVNAKKMHFIHHLYHGADGYLAAASEWLAIHVDLEQRRSAPFPDDVAARLEAICSAHAVLPIPPEVGRVVSIDASKPGSA